MASLPDRLEDSDIIAYLDTIFIVFLIKYFIYLSISFFVPGAERVSEGNFFELPHHIPCLDKKFLNCWLLYFPATV